MCLALLGAASMLYYYQGLFIPRLLEVRSARNLDGGYSFGNDFYQVWLTSRQALRDRRDPYTAAMTREIQTGLYGRTLDPRIPSDPSDLRMFPYPAFTDLLLWPAARLPFPLVRVVVACLLTALTLVGIRLWMRAFSWQLDWRWIAVTCLLVLCSYPVLEGLYAGQIGLLVAFLLAASILTLQRGRLLFSGFLMALTTIKPQVTLLAILYLLVWSAHAWRRRGRFCAGFFPTIILLIGAALVVWPHWIQSWLHVVVRYHGYTKPALVSEVFASPLGPYAAGPASLIMTAALLMAAVVLGWKNRAAAADSQQFWLTLSLSLGITTIALLPGQAVYDHVILLPGIFLLASRKQPEPSGPIFRTLLAIGIAVLLWPWLSALSLLLLRPLLPAEIFYSKAVFVLPLRTAAVFPFVVLAPLILTLRARSQKQRELAPASLPSR
jgi:hypothetical protein